jgi:hypothetical protein
MIGRIVVLLGCAVAWCTTGCTSSSSNGPSCTVPGGPVEGAADTHCAAPAPFDLAACHADAAATSPDAGTGSGQPPATRFGTEADDDDCKVHLSWTSTAVCKGDGVTFTVAVTNKTDGSTVTGADAYIEAFLSDIHPAPNSGASTVEDPPGTYAIGPVRFDASGRWTVRFHLFGTCDDTPLSPHSHVSFFVDVP